MVCRLCPRNCGAERTDDINIGGVCKMPLKPVVARAALHMWEEPCISGKNGSGTVFFSGCSLGCVFCQNCEISHKNYGKAVTVQRLSEIFYELAEKKAENINLVNPTHYVPSIAEAFRLYKPPIPVVYNSGGYDTESEIRAAAEFAGVFLMDLKYLTAERALRYSKAENYPEVATKAIKLCAELVNGNIFDENGMMKKGLIIRHLIMPAATNEAISVIDWVEKNVPWAVLSLMGQYTPCGDLSDYKEINRTITPREYKKVLSYAEDSKIETIYKQSLSSGKSEYIPHFDLTGI